MIIKKGDKFNRLTAIKFIKKIKYKSCRNVTEKWLFKCDCGNKKEIFVENVIRNHTKSCGCWQKKRAKECNLKHGCYKKPEYKIWKTIKQRCYKKSFINYKNYGGRGIKISKEWRDSFEKFLKDMGERPMKGMSIDRIDNNKGYCKKNCRWVTSKEQANNRRDNIFILMNGVKISFNELADFFSLKESTLYYRIFGYKWDFKKALLTKKRKYANKKI